MHQAKRQRALVVVGHSTTANRNSFQQHDEIERPVVKIAARPMGIVTRQKISKSE